MKLRLPSLQQIIPAVFLTIAFLITPALAAPRLEITAVADLPDPFSPDNDQMKETTKLTAKVSFSGFSPIQKQLAWMLTIADANNNLVNYFTDSTPVSGSGSSLSLTKTWDGRDRLGKTVRDGKYYYTWIAKLMTSSAEKTGEITVKCRTLSVDVVPETWNIGAIPANSTALMPDANRIIVLNSGTRHATYSLCLRNPPAWSFSIAAPSAEKYVLNAAFSSTTTVSWKESSHALSVAPIRCSAKKFAGNQTGTNVAPGAIRILRLQFKAPTKTVVTDEQNIEVIITAEIP